MADVIRATPYRSPVAGGINDLIGGLLGYMRDPRRTQQLQGLAGLLESTGIPKTVERLAYGEPLTNVQMANVSLLKPETAEAALTLLPVPSGANKAAMAAGRAGERYAERVVPQIMERGGVPAGLLEAMATRTTSKMFVPATAEEAYQASKMLKSNTPQEVWQKIGVVRGPDGEWRKEISDKASKYDPEALADLKARDNFDYIKHTQPFDTVLEHKKLFEYDPSLGDIPVHFMPAEKMGRAYGAYSPTHNRLTLRDTLSPEKARSSALHEIQHAIQEKSGFAVGGNARDFAKIRYEADQQIGVLNEKMRDIVRQIDNPATTQQEKALLRNQYDDLINERQSLVSNAQIDPEEAYGNLMGEAEARLTQRRMDLTDKQRRENFPFEYTGEVGYGLDVPLEGLIQMTPEGTIIRRGLLGQ